MKRAFCLPLHFVAAVGFVWLAAASDASAQAPAPLPTDQILDHERATPARKACFEFLLARLKRTGRSANEEHPDLTGRNICLYARKFGYQGKVE